MLIDERMNSTSVLTIGNSVCVYEILVVGGKCSGTLDIVPLL